MTYKKKKKKDAIIKSKGQDQGLSLTVTLWTSEFTRPQRVAWPLRNGPEPGQRTARVTKVWKRLRSHGMYGWGHWELGED